MDSPTRERVLKIEENAQKKSYLVNHPTKNELSKMNEIIYDFIIKNKRIVLGGSAINAILKNNGKEGIYPTKLETLNDIYDVEFFSTTPIDDIHFLCDLIFDAGFEQVFGDEAIHKNTYTIRYFSIGVCDITYMPANLYPFIPRKVIDKVTYCSPHFLMVDFYRARSNPTNSFWNLSKFMERQYLIKQSYPEFTIKKDCTKDNFKNLSIAENICHHLGSELLPDDIFIPIGTYATNIMLDSSTHSDDKRFPVKILRMICFDLRKGLEKAKSAIEKIGNKMDISITEAKWTEYVPFFEYYGDSLSCSLSINGKLQEVLRLYSNRDRCLPTINYNGLQMPSFDVIIVFWYYIWIRDLVEKTKISTAPCAIAHLLEVQRLEETNAVKGGKKRRKKKDKQAKSKENISKLNPLFQTLRETCIGEEDHFLSARSLERSKKKQEGKLPIYRYNPLNGKRSPGKYIFENISGNPIINQSKHKYLN
tara:strand:+ start:1460 stop:2893 length:1434 start_codon:yes stop_codon:yes gene_type:complete